MSGDWSDKYLNPKKCRILKFWLNYIFDKNVNKLIVNNTYNLLGNR